MVWWMKYQIFVPIFLLQLVNLCTSTFSRSLSSSHSFWAIRDTELTVWLEFTDWYFLIWRVLYRIVFTGIVADERSDDEGDDEDPKKK